MSSKTIALVIALAVTLIGCTVSGQTSVIPPKWGVGFWFWQGSEVSEESRNLQLDSLYFQSGSIEHEEVLGVEAWHVSRNLPSPLPQTGEYWMVLRYERQGVPALGAIPKLVESLNWVKTEAARRRLPLSGVQLDIDAPTGSLREYAVFLREVRKTLPKGMQLSITALLDWFRDGTAVAEVLKDVDEFVPQFYDLSGSKRTGGAISIGVTQPQDIRPIAAKLDGALWGAKFNKYGKRYRIGISSFGRSGIVAAGRFQVYSDLSPLTLAANSAFVLKAEQTPAREIILKYRAIRKSQLSYVTFLPGDLVEFVLPTVEAVRDAYNNAKRMGGYCAGVLFFRWPARDHDIVLDPAEVIGAIGTSRVEAGPRVVAQDGGCAAVHCVDLHLFNIDGRASSRGRYILTSSLPIEYFLAEKDVPVRLSGPGELDLALPPFAGTSHIFLGRAVTAKRAEFSVKREP